MGRSAPLGRRTRRPTSTLSVIGPEISPPSSGDQRLPEALEGLIQRIRHDRLLADGARVCDRRAVTHHVDAALPTADQAGARDLDPGVDTLIGSVFAEHTDRGEAALEADLLDPPPGFPDRLVERGHLLPVDTGPVPDRHLPAHGHAD